MGKRAFTLIELLIVVAIIAILAAIAVPNFLEAQTRAKVSRVKSDMRTAQTALEAYRVDNTAYPVHRLYLEDGYHQWDRGGIFGFIDLTTPIAYMTTTDLRDPFIPEVPADRFGDIAFLEEAQGQVSRTINLINREVYRTVNQLRNDKAAWVLISYGPDVRRGPIPGINTPYLFTYAELNAQENNYLARAQYDPTNGTVSGGDIMKWQQ